jgi:hypothetical protein
MTISQTHVTVLVQLITKELLALTRLTTVWLRQQSVQTVVSALMTIARTLVTVLVQLITKEVLVLTPLMTVALIHV